MDFDFTDEQHAIRETASGIFAGMVTPDRVAEIEATTDRVDRELWRALAEADLLGVGTPEVLGGIGGGLIEAGMMLEEQGKVVAPSPLLATLVGGVLPLAKFGPTPLKEKWLPQVIAGNAILTSAIADVSTSPRQLPALTAVLQGSEWIVSGTANAVPFAHVADAILVPVRIEGDGVIVAMISKNQSGVTLERAETTNRAVHPHVHFDSVAVGPADLVAGPDRGVEATAFMLDSAMTALALTQIGVCEAALAQTAAHLNEREQFGRPLSTFQGTMLRAADAAIDLEAIRVTAWQAAWRIDGNLPATESVLVAKWQAADRGQRVVHATQHLHGGTGADIGYPIHRYFLWGKQIELELGSPSLQLSRLGTLIAQRPDEIMHR